MLNEYGMYQGYNVEGAKEMVTPTQTGMCCEPIVGATEMCGTVLPQVCEPMNERQIHRCIVHEVPHVCPINTRIINHHIYKHTYCPCYTCCEENVVSNIQEGSCCNF